MRIGQLARLCGVSPDTIRHYERLRLLRPARRTPTGYRVYLSDAAARVRVVQAALSVGFTLAELSRLLGEPDAGRPPCREDHRVANMVRLRDGMRALLANWDARLEKTPAGGRAGLLDAFGSNEAHLDLPPRSPAVATSKRRKTS